MGLPPIGPYSIFDWRGKKIEPPFFARETAQFKLIRKRERNGRKCTQINGNDSSKLNNRLNSDNNRWENNPQSD